MSSATIPVTEDFVVITGSVGGDARVGDIVSISISGGTPATGPVAGDKTFSINIKVLSSYVSSGSFNLIATVTATDSEGNTGTATAPYNYTDGAPEPTIALNSNITADDIINLTEAAGTVAITAEAGGHAIVGDNIKITVNGVITNGFVQSGNTFSINVNGSDLVADSDKLVEATITTINSEGVSGTATDSEGYSIAGSAPVPTIILDKNITADDVIDHIEQLSTAIAITGTAGGDAKEGDTISITVNGVTVTGPVVGNLFSINVFGSSLVSDSDRTVEASITSIDAFGNSSIAYDTSLYC